VKYNYLINDQVTFCFDLEEQYIACNDLKEILQLKEAQILKYMIDTDSNDAIPSKLILDDNWTYWSDKRVLHKVLSNLRKKFKNIGLLENGFVAVGAEYKFNYHYQLIEKPQVKPVPSSALHDKINQAKGIKPIAVLTVLLLLIFTSIFTFYTKDNDSFNLDSLLLTTPIEGVSTDPSLSPDGQRLAFTYRRGVPDAGSQIVLSTDNNNQFTFLTQGHNDQTPSWSPSGTKIAFQRRTVSSCEILLIHLDEHFNKTAELETLADCNKNTSMTSITWKSEDELFFTKINKPGGPYEIFTINLNDKSTTPYFTYDEEKYTGVGHYFINYNTDHQSLFSLSSEDRKRSSFNRIVEQNQSNTIKIFDDRLWGIGFIKGQAVFIDLDNQLKAFSITNPNHFTTLLKNPLKKIAYPVISKNSQRIAMISGNTYRHNLLKMNLINHEVAEVLSSQTSITSPKSVGYNVYYQSAESGIHQIFVHNKKLNQQVTSFTHNREINYFVVSNDERWLAIDFMKGTEIYQLDENKVIFKTHFAQMHNPAFSHNNERILLSTKVTNNKNNAEQSNIIEYALADLEKTGISIKNGYFGIYHNKGIVFVSTRRTINLFNLNNITVISSNSAPTIPNLLAVNDKSIFVSSRNKMIKIEIEGGQEIELPAVLDGEFDVNNLYVYFKKQRVGRSMVYSSKITQVHK
jgi:hypothetical protein